MLTSWPTGEIVCSLVVMASTPRSNKDLPSQSFTLETSEYNIADATGYKSKRIRSLSSNLETKPRLSYDYNEHIMDQTQDFKSLQDQIQAALLATTRVSGQISSEDLGFQRSLNPQVGTALEEQTARLLELAGSLLRSAASISELQVPVLDDADDVDSNWRNIVDVVDSLLEKTDICLDEYTGVIKRKEAPIADQASS